MTFSAATVGTMIDRLKESPAISPLVGRVRLRSIPAGTSTALVVRPVGSDVVSDELNGYPISWRATYQVECYARAVNGAAPDEAVDALLAAAYSRILFDPTLGGLAIQLQPQSIAYDFDVDGEQTVCAVLSFSALHRTVGATL